MTSVKQAGRRGGNARAIALSPDRRREIAQAAARARWAKRAALVAACRCGGGCDCHTPVWRKGQKCDYCEVAA